MQPSTIFFIAAGIVLLWAICVGLFAGKTYFRVLLFNLRFKKDFLEKYDLKKLKAVHVITILLVMTCFLSIALSGIDKATQVWPIMIIFFAILSAQPWLIWKVCKKTED